MSSYFIGLRCFFQTSSYPPGWGSVQPLTWLPDPAWHIPSPGTKGMTMTNLSHPVEKSNSCRANKQMRYLRSHGFSPQTLLIQFLVRTCTHGFRAKGHLAAQVGKVKVMQNVVKLNDASTEQSAQVTCHRFRRGVELPVWHGTGVDHGGTFAGGLHGCQVGWERRDKSRSESQRSFVGPCSRLAHILPSPLSSSASCVSTLKSRNHVSSQANTNEVMGNT